MGDVLQRIREARDLKIEPVEVPEWGLTVYVRSLPSIRRDAFDLATSGGGKTEEDVADAATNLRARLAAYCLCDESGEFLAGDPEAFAAELGQKSTLPVRRLYLAAAAINGMTEDAVELAKKKALEPAGTPVQVPAGEGAGEDLPGAG